MLKHMLTHTGRFPKSPEAGDPRSPSDPSIHNMEELPGSPLLETRIARTIRIGGTSSESPERRVSSASNHGRPVSVHGNVMHNQSIYANTVPVSKMNGGLNISSSAPNTSRLNASMNANLNLSNNMNSSSNASPGTTNQTRTTLMDSSSRDNSHHDLNSTQISPIGRSNKQQIPPGRNRYDKTGMHKQNNLNLTNSIGSPNLDASRRQSFHNSTAHQNGGLNITSQSTKRPFNASFVPANVSRFIMKSEEAGVKEMITSLAVLCLVSLIMAALSVVLFVKISPDTQMVLKKTFTWMSDYELKLLCEVTMSMCALVLSLNICCLLVCAIQFLFAVKLVKSAQGRARSNKYLKEASMTRTCAISGFFISIPVFLTVVILFTFLHFDSPPSIVTAIVIGAGIIFCGLAVVHNVFVWQREKLKAKSPANQVLDKNTVLNHTTNKKGSGLNVHGSLPQATLDLSGGGGNATVVSSHGLELSTLV